MLAYLDDVVVVTPAGLAAEVVPTARQVLRELGLTLREDKTQAWSSRAPCPAGLEGQWRTEGLTLVGVPLGGALPAHGLPDESDNWRVDLGTGSYEARRCGEVAARAAALLGRFAELPALASPHLPAVQVAALLLRVCGTGKVAHMLRSNPPTSTAAAAGTFDEAVLQAYTALASLGH